MHYAAAITLLALLATSGCRDAEATSEEHARLAEAVTEAVCATNREDRELALGNIADEAFFHDRETINSYVTDIAADATCKAPPPPEGFTLDEQG